MNENARPTAAPAAAAPREAAPLRSEREARRIAVAGAAGLAAAMGIGRFAFTPLLPLMQAEGQLTLTQGGWLASANYAGYLAGALAAVAFDPPPARAARLGLWTVAVATLAMAAAPSFAAALAWRALAGAASALVLVALSTWAQSRLAALGRAAWTGWVFCGIGVGIAGAGLVALAIGASGAAAARAWLGLGALAAAIAIFVLGVLRRDFAGRGAPLAAARSGAAAGRRFPHGARLLVLCYGAYGFGYIVPATFLPAIARALVDDPAVFGSTWPLVGLAAAASTVALGRLERWPPRRVWAALHGVMALGVALPAWRPTLAAVVFSAIAVGGTFVAVTMVALREARRVAGDGAARLMAAMTAAFAAGQWLGPLAVVGDGAADQAMRAPSAIAAAVLAVSAIALAWPEARRR